VIQFTSGDRDWRDLGPFFRFLQVSKPEIQGWVIGTDEISFLTLSALPQG